MPTAYTNAKFFTGESFEEGKAVLTDLGIITDVVDADAIPHGYTKIDLDGENVAPAFIDLQIYGGNGKMFSEDPGIESIQRTYDYCLTGGASHFMITVATNTMDVMLRSIEAVRAYWQNGGKGLLGLHLEGPYLNPAKKGAHVESLIKPPTLEEVKMLIEKGGDVIKMITIAPELCPDEVLEFLCEHVMVVSAGHTNATYEQAQAAFGKGIPVATHLFNAMTGFQHRAPGVVGAIFNDANAMSSIVCDGVHVDFAAVRVAKTVMEERLFYITDAVTETNDAVYPHVFKGDRFTLPDGTLSGSALTMIKCVKNGIEKVGICLEESLRMASQYPGSLLLKEMQIGKIEENYLAQFVVMDDDYNVIRVIS